MVYNSIADYLEAKNNWEQTLAKINRKGMFLFLEHEWVPIEKVPNNTKPMYEPFVKDNPDGRRLSPSVRIKNSRKTIHIT